MLKPDEPLVKSQLQDAGSSNLFAPTTKDQGFQHTSWSPFSLSRQNPPLSHHLSLFVFQTKRVYIKQIQTTLLTAFCLWIIKQADENQGQNLSLVGIQQSREDH